MRSRLSWLGRADLLILVPVTPVVATPPRGADTETASPGTCPNTDEHAKQGSDVGHKNHAISTTPARHAIKYVRPSSALTGSLSSHLTASETLVAAAPARVAEGLRWTRPLLFS